jgi:NAD(P)-dependent dehydrogenase (short-subunit alcohol dehydrogenase family)
MSALAALALEGRTAVVTGAGAGIGRAAARRFAQAGAHVIACDLDRDAVQETCDSITAAGPEATAICADVASVPALRALFAQVDADFGALDILYNHAGSVAPTGIDAAEDEWSRAVDVNMKSGYFATQLAHPLLKKSGRASVIFTSSISGLVASPSACYSMAKGGVVMLGKSLAVLMAPDGIRVNVICPGPIATATLDASISQQGDPRSVQESIVSRVPLGRLGAADEVASVALFLASDAASYVTGVVIPVDGGYTAQ